MNAPVAGFVARCDSSLRLKPLEEAVPDIAMDLYSEAASIGRPYDAAKSEAVWSLVLQVHRACYLVQQDTALRPDAAYLIRVLVRDMVLEMQKVYREPWQQSYIRFSGGRSSSFAKKLARQWRLGVKAAIIQRRWRWRSIVRQCSQ